MLYIMKYSFIWYKNKKGVKYDQKYLKVFTKYWTQQTTSMKKKLYTIIHSCMVSLAKNT